MVDKFITGNIRPGAAKSQVNLGKSFYLAISIRLPPILSSYANVIQMPAWDTFRTTDVLWLQ